MKKEHVIGTRLVFSANVQVEKDLKRQFAAGLAFKNLDANKNPKNYVVVFESGVYYFGFSTREQIAEPLQKANEILENWSKDKSTILGFTDIQIIKNETY